MRTDEEAWELVVENLDFIGSIAGKINRERAIPWFLDVEDVKSYFVYLAFRAAKRHDGRIEFRTYVYFRLVNGFKDMIKGKIADGGFSRNAPRTAFFGGMMHDEDNSGGEIENPRCLGFDEPGFERFENSDFNRHLGKQLQKLVGTLKGKQQHVLRGYFIEEKSLQTIADELGVTESRVCQIKQEALKKLRLKVEKGNSAESLRVA